MTTDTLLAHIQDELVEIPAGTTLIGSTADTVDAELAQPDMKDVQRGWLRKEIPRYTVTLPRFWISRIPLTVRQVEALAPATGIRPILAAGPDHPATVGVAASFTLCRALSELIGRTVTLPTEQQWVRAARGDDDRIYPWGDTWREGLANMAGSSLGATCPVGSYPKGGSALGLLDMAGNADELTSTRYAPFPGAPPDVPSTDDWAHAPYITKGGGYMHLRDLARCDRRHSIYAQDEPLAIRLVVS